MQPSADTPRLCSQCGQAFQPRRQTQSYCSRACANAARVTTVELTCQQCGKPFYRNRAAAPKAHYCSSSCRNEALRATPVTLVCQQCGQEFARSRRAEQPKYCSLACCGAAQRCRIARICVQCGVEFSVPPKAASQKCCSKACADQHRRRFLVRLECEWCGKEYFVQRTRTDSHYCSSACQHAAINRRVEMICDTCGTSFTTPRWSEGRTRYCSRACKDQGAYNSVELQCTLSITAGPGQRRPACDSGRVCW